METRPPVWIGHARLTVSDLARSADFWHTVGMREIGLDVSPIQRGRIHSAFVLRDPDGTNVTVNSSHAVGVV